MKALMFIITKTLKNIIKNLKKKPLALAGYIVIFLFIIFFIGISIFMPANNFGGGSVELFRSIMAGITLIALYFSLKQGIEKGSSFFRFADVNLVFTAPIETNKVLLYGFIKQFGAIGFTIMLVIFQIPNLRNNFPLMDYGIIIIILATFLFVIIYPLIGMLLFTYSSKSKKNKSKLKIILNTIFGIIAAGLIIQIFVEKDFYLGAIKFLDSKYFSLIPVAGWFKNILSAAVDGISTTFYFNLGLVIILFAFLFSLVYKMKSVDYYEDVLDATEHKEKMIKSKKEGKGNASLYTGKINKKISAKFTVMGSKAIFQKNFLEYRKTGFMFIDKTSIIIIIFGILSGFFMSSFNIFSTLFASIYMLFIFSLQGRWSNELSKPYIYLIPSKSLSKMFYSTLTENIKNFIDGTILFIIAGLIFKENILIIILCIIAFTMYGAIFLYGEVLSRKLFGSVHGKVLKVFLKIFLALGIIIPGIVIMTIIGVTTSNRYLMLGVLVLWNTAAALALLFASKNIFEKIEVD